ncbi:MAG TPA: 2OG-Fe(II) oxygenase [Allosphingosinicella sp.]|nr:2OG-Fe(II) oxygenase [Allosphingosinicella sp.]
MAGLYLAVPDALSGAQCDAAIGLADERLAPAPVYGGDGARIEPMMRDAGSALIERAEAEWLFERLDALFARGAEAFALPVGPIAEPIQIVRYATGGHFQMWHSDAGGDRVEQRRISMSVELSALADHAGGALEVVPDLVGRPRTLARGGAHLFPSRALHRVGPVTRGTRWALVAWTG